MITYPVYKLLHLLGVLGLFVSLGAASAGDRAQTRWVAPIHGISLLLILVAGFGLLARLETQGFPHWAIAKLMLWIFMGGAIAIARRKKIPSVFLALILIALGGIAASLAIWKP